MSAENAPSQATAPTAESPSSDSAPKAEGERHLTNPVEKKADAKAKAVGELREKLAREKAERESGKDDSDDEPAPRKKSAPKAEPKKDAPAKAPKADEPTAKAEKIADKIEDAGGKAPDQRDGESDKAYELRLSQALGKAERMERELNKLRSEHDLSTKEVKRLQKLMEDGKTNPLLLLEAVDWDYEKLARGIVDKKVTRPEAKPKLPPEIMEEIELSRAERKERKEREEREAATVSRTKHVTDVQAFIDARADDFPLVAAAKWSAEKVVERAYAQGGQVQVLEILQALEAGLETDLDMLLDSDKVSRKVATKRGKAFAKLLKELNISAEEAAEVVEEAAEEAEEEDDEEEAPKKKRPKSINDIKKDGTAPRKKSRADMIAEAAAELRRKRSKGEED